MVIEMLKPYSIESTLYYRTISTFQLSCKNSVSKTCRQYFVKGLLTSYLS